MQAIISFYARLTLLRNAPQDGPVSDVLQKLLMTLYLISGTTKSLMFYDMTRSMASSVIDLLFLILFIRVLLASKQQRIHQTLNAMLGAGIILSAVLTVASHNFIVGPDTKTLSSLASIIFFLIFAWVVLVHAHIVRHAMDATLSVGVMVSLGYSFVNTIVVMTMLGLMGV